jgi:hypothetical protein
VNEYTRREEVRWTLIASLLMVLCIAPAVILLVTAKGKLVPDQEARRAADEATEKVKPAHACTVAANKLQTEIGPFKATAKAAHLDVAEEAPDPKGKNKKPKTLSGKIRRGLKNLKDKTNEPDVSLAWNAAQPVQKAAKLLAPCKVAIEASVGERADAAPAWAAVAKASGVSPTADDKKEELEAARTLLKLWDDKLPLDKIVAQAKDAEEAAKKEAADLSAKADTAMVRAPIPEGLIPRRLAVGIGVGLSVIALLLSYLSVRVASNRRLMTLVPLREAAKSTQPGLHAAAVLRLAAAPNGGLPGAVIGGAVGGLIAAAVAASDTDVFIGGVMTGFLIGLGTQFLFRMLAGAGAWRQRATELAEIEKPAIPVVLVLSGVNPGLEAPFIKFFTGLSETDAATTVEKLAAQAEERILAAADAGAAARQAAGGAPGM